MATPDCFLHIRRSERRDFGWSRSTLLLRSRPALRKAIEMTLRQKLLKLGSPARVAVFAVSICACALSPEAYAENPKAAPVALRDSLPIQASGVPPATFFTINAVLAKLDRSQGRGRNAIRLVSLKSSNTATDAGPALTEIPAARHRAVWTVRVPRSRRSTLAEVAGRRIRHDQGRKGSGAMQGRR